MRVYREKATGVGVLKEEKERKRREGGREVERESSSN